jgi:hypothetical protein
MPVEAPVTIANCRLLDIGNSPSSSIPKFETITVASVARSESRCEDPGGEQVVDASLSRFDELAGAAARTMLTKLDLKSVTMPWREF